MTDRLAALLGADYPDEYSWNDLEAVAEEALDTVARAVDDRQGVPSDRARFRLALADFYAWANGKPTASGYTDHGTALKLADEWLEGGPYG